MIVLVVTKIIAYTLQFIQLKFTSDDFLLLFIVTLCSTGEAEFQGYDLEACQIIVQKFGSVYIDPWDP